MGRQLGAVTLPALAAGAPQGSDTGAEFGDPAFTAVIQELFDLYQVRFDGFVYEEEFRAAQSFLKQSNGVDDAAGLPVAAQRQNQRAGSFSAPQQRRAGPQQGRQRGDSIERHVTADFQHVDRDGEGRISFNAFSAWQLQCLAASRKPRAAKLQRLHWFVRDLSALEAGDGRFVGWRQLGRSVRKAESDKQGDPLGAIELLGKAVAESQCDGALVEDARRKLADWQEELRNSLKDRLATATDFRSLQEAIRFAERALPSVGWGADVLEQYQERLGAWEQPFDVLLQTIAGEELSLQVTRRGTVKALKESAAQAFEVRPYRISLATPTRRLEPDSASLESVGVCGSAVAIAVSMGEPNRWIEMEPAELFAACLDHRVLNDSTERHFHKMLKEGNLDTVAVYQKVGAQLERAEEAQRRKEQAHEEERQRLRKAATESAAGLTVERAHESLQDARRQQETWFEEARNAELELTSELNPLAQTVAEHVSTLSKAEDEHYKEVPDILYETLHLDESTVDCEKMGRDLPVIQAFCILRGIRPQRAVSDAGGFFEEYFTGFLRCLKELRFVQHMESFDMDNIRPQALNALPPLLEQDNFTPKWSPYVLVPLSAWVRAVYVYAVTLQRMEPVKRIMEDRKKQLKMLEFTLEALSLRAGEQ